jgi:flagellar hook-length control protein FliK
MSFPIDQLISSPPAPEPTRRPVEAPASPRASSSQDAQRRDDDVNSDNKDTFRQHLEETDNSRAQDQRAHEQRSVDEADVQKSQAALTPSAQSEVLSASTSDEKPKPTIAQITTTGPLTSEVDSKGQNTGPISVLSSDEAAVSETTNKKPGAQLKASAGDTPVVLTNGEDKSADKTFKSLEAVGQNNLSGEVQAAAASSRNDEAAKPSPTPPVQTKAPTGRKSFDVGTLSAGKDAPSDPGSTNGAATPTVSKEGIVPASKTTSGAAFSEETTSKPNKVVSPSKGSKEEFDAGSNARAAEDVSPEEGANAGPLSENPQDLELGLVQFDGPTASKVKSGPDLGTKVVTEVPTNTNANSDAKGKPSQPSLETQTPNRPDQGAPAQKDGAKEPQSIGKTTRGDQSKSDLGTRVQDEIKPPSEAAIPAAQAKVSLELGKREASNKAVPSTAADKRQQQASPIAQSAKNVPTQTLPISGSTPEELEAALAASPEKRGMSAEEKIASPLAEARSKTKTANGETKIGDPANPGSAVQPSTAQGPQNPASTAAPQAQVTPPVQTFTMPVSVSEGDGIQQVTMEIDPETGALQVSSASTARPTAPGLSEVTLQFTRARMFQAPAKDIAVQIAKHVADGVNKFEIRISPPELGRIEVKLEITDGGKVSAHLVAEKSETLDLLQKDRSTLEKALAEAGLDVDQDALNFSMKEESDGEDCNFKNFGTDTSGETGEETRQIHIEQLVNTEVSTYGFDVVRMKRLDISI